MDAEDAIAAILLFCRLAGPFASRDNLVIGATTFGTGPTAAGFGQAVSVGLASG
jgi:hypothetical protein